MQYLEGLGGFTERQRKGSWMQTATGRAYWPVDPRADEVFIEDIAHALGNLCRYAGHTKLFYSVAEHSIHVSRLVPQEHALVALLHDATEAYCVDVPRPLKQHLPGYKEIEARNWAVVAERFGLPLELPQCVHDADVAMLFAERDALLLPSPRDDWGMGLATPIKAKVNIFGYMPGRASTRFLQRFEELTEAEALV